MSTLQERIQEVMRDTSLKTPTDVARAAKVTPSAVSQWLGNGAKAIHTIGKIEAAMNLARATGYSWMWLAKGAGPRKAADAEPPIDDPEQLPMTIDQASIDAPPPLTAEAIAEGLCSSIDRAKPDTRAKLLKALTLYAEDPQLFPHMRSSIAELIRRGELEDPLLEVNLRVGNGR